MTQLRGRTSVNADPSDHSLAGTVGSNHAGRMDVSLSLSRSLSLSLSLSLVAVVCCRVYRVSQEERARFREGVPYVKVYQYNPKHLCPNLNGYGDNDQRSLKL